MRSGVYAIFCKATGVPYIGSSQTARMRITSHFGLLRRGKHHSVKLQQAWQEHGEAQFVGCILEFCPIELLNDRENFYIQAWDAVASGYNQTLAPTDFFRNKARQTRFSSNPPAIVIHIYR